MPETAQHPPELNVLMIVVDRRDTGRLEDFLRDKWVAFHYMMNAEGTASSDVLKSFGLSGGEKTICACIVRKGEAKQLVTSVSDYFKMTKAGNGIVYTLPVSGISAVISKLLSGEDYERTVTKMEEMAKKADNAYCLVISMINHGYSEALMDAAHSVGVRGGTIINARHSAIEDTVKFFGVTLQAEKEVVAIVIPISQKAELMRAIGQKCGLGTDAHGIIISVPVEDCAGIEMEPGQPA